MVKTHGYFISFEGGEGTGKSTQVALLQGRLEEAKISSMATCEPGGTNIGKQIREILLHTMDDSRRLSPMSESLLFGFDRFEHLQQVIRPALAEGKWVLCDRFADSTLAYQGYALGGNIAEIKTLNALVLGETLPDLTFVLDIAVEKSLARARTRNEEFSYYDDKTIEFHEKIRAAFLEIAGNNADRCVVIDSDASVQKVAEHIDATIRERLSVVFP